MALFEGYERRIDQITPVLKQYGIESIEACADICKEKGVDVYEIVKEIQPLAFENAARAYVVSTAIAIKKGRRLHPTWQRPSAKACRHSASRVRLQTTAKSVSATAIWLRCY